MWSRLLHLLVLVLCGSVLASGTRMPRAVAAAAPQEEKGATGASRIISLIPAVTEMLYAVGAGAQVVAVGSFDRFPAEVAALPRVGALLDPDLERILALRPDLVAVYATQAELRQQLERAGIPLFVYKHGRLADVAATLRRLGERVGRGERGAQIASAIERDLDAIRRRVAGRARPRTLLVIARETGALRGIFASGGHGFLHDVLEVAGGENVFADVGRESIQATSELILARRPDVIVELRGGAGGPLDPALERRAWQALSAVPAVRTNRLHFIQDDRAVNPGPRVAEGARLVARALHPSLF